uniref:Radial spoke head 14 homolog n=1 Tax=Taeniopygia guttata TaxID=59729 RepID=H0ZI78_TAEGU|nr:radial spoke head 14 homolog isoform X1 [Taeniopygia guttata]XP_041575246.1 radial spoke head 14 homolog isoform X1 [Taeniopygia guttata]XP_041575247.1 radial spoke head 14 homolog isoform X1 [Taeniopygia guttata]
MAQPRISAYLPPDIDPTKAALAFGRRALPKLNEELQSAELLTQQRALMALCDLVHDPEKVYQAIALGFLASLKTLLVHQDQTVRQKTTEVLSIMALHSIGREGLIRSGVISALAGLLDDPVDICRKNTHQIFDMLAKLPEGAGGVLQAGLIPPLVLKMQTELDEIQELILGTLSNCLRVEVSEALAAGAVPVLKEKLSHPSTAIRSKAAWVLLEISSHAEGKIEVCKEEVIPVLVSLLEDTQPEVQVSSTGALMFALVTPQGRSSAMGAEAIPPLLTLVAEETSKARLNAIKTLTLLAELPEGRQTLLDHRDTFQRCLDDPSEAVQRAAEIAITVIDWKPSCSRDLF